MTENIAVMGNRDSIKGFMTVGFDIFPCESIEKAEETFSLITDGKYAVIYITEDYYTLLEKEIEKYKGKMLPCITPIPALDSSGETGKKMLSFFVVRAVGSDIIFGS